MLKLTDPEFIRKLEMLSLLARKVLGGTLKADRKTAKKGSGTTFADYTEYNFGDDYRSIDWNIYARLEHLVIKLFELEEDLHIYLLVDFSHSMYGKSRLARQLAGALGYIALNNLDRLTVYALADHLKPILKPAHGRNRLLPMLQALESAECFGHDTDFEQCIKEFQSRKHRSGLCIIISDFFVSGALEKSLDYLLWNRHDLFCLQVYSETDVQCKLRGDVELQCIETGEKRRVTIGPAEAARFTAAVKTWNNRVQQACKQRGIGFATAPVEVPFELIIQNILRHGGLVK
ncbi:DUF58 domain-containing protein [Lentisphaerota bacterium ZTH]|nr:DUF58 domain-containing protein [Lentisphaerota bacterium]WET05984.1 DUF58 domain-containing protein [Lentisphaerota bacterium ZTH]